MSKAQENLVSDLRTQLAAYEHEIKGIQESMSRMEEVHKKRCDGLVSRAQQATSAYISLRKRRDYEIEGFTNEIIALRRDIKRMEKTLLKFGPLEDRELVLLGIVQETGRKADGIGRELRGVKNKVYGIENQIQGLELLK